MPGDENAAPICPRCGSQEILPIAYGYPSAEGFAMAERGEVMLGGCCLSRESPRWWCQACKHSFGDHEETYREFFDRIRPRNATKQTELGRARESYEQ